MQKVEIKEAKEHLSELVDQAVKGEEVVITQNDRPLVKMVPVKPEEKRREFGSAKGLIAMADDFDAPLSDLAEYQ